MAASVGARLCAPGMTSCRPPLSHSSRTPYHSGTTHDSVGNVEAALADYSRALQLDAQSGSSGGGGERPGGSAGVADSGR
jgi:hypothetical protein